MRSSRLTRGLQILALSGLLLVNVHWADPFYTWDTVAYIGVAHGLAGESSEAAHRAAYEAARKAMPAGAYRSLTEGNEYKRTVARDPAAFEQQLPFYLIKPAYPLLILGFNRIGVGEVKAGVLLSRAAYFGIGVLLLVWLGAFLSPLPATATAWGLMSVPFVLSLSRLSTPDALSTLVVLSALWLGFERGRFRAGALVLLFSVLVRPDNIIWLVVVAGYLWFQSDQRRTAVVVSAAGVLLYLAVAAWSGSLGWRTLFHHTFVELLPYPDAFTPTLSLMGYLKVYLRAGHPRNLPAFLALFALLGIWLAVARVRRYGLADRGVGLLMVAGLFAALHWGLFPGDERFLVPVYVVVVMLLLRTLTEGVRAPGPGVMQFDRGSRGPADHSTQ